jgi:hypothetical protein
MQLLMYGSFEETTVQVSRALFPKLAIACGPRENQVIPFRILGQDEFNLKAAHTLKAQLTDISRLCTDKHVTRITKLLYTVRQVNLIDSKPV